MMRTYESRAGEYDLDRKKYNEVYAFIANHMTTEVLRAYDNNPMLTTPPLYFMDPFGENILIKAETRETDGLSSCPTLAELLLNDNSLRLVIHPNGRIVVNPDELHNIGKRYSLPTPHRPSA